MSGRKLKRNRDSFEAGPPDQILTSKTLLMLISSRLGEKRVKTTKIQVKRERGLFNLPKSVIIEALESHGNYLKYLGCTISFDYRSAGQIINLSSRVFASIMGVLALLYLIHYSLSKQRFKS